MPVIAEIEELDRIVASKPPKTITYRVSREVAEINHQRLAECEWLALQPLTGAEELELANYLGVDVREVQQAQWEFEPGACAGCGRRLSLVDFVNQAVVLGIHDRKFAADVLFHRNPENYFITVAGVDDNDHKMRCIECGLVASGSDCFYKCSTKTYASPIPPRSDS